MTQTDHAELQRILHDRIDGEVQFDDGSRAPYSTDASNLRSPGPVRHRSERLSRRLNHPRRGKGYMSYAVLVQGWNAACSP